MEPLDDLTRGFVHAHRRHESPPEGSEARILAALEQQLGGPPGGEDPSGGEPGGEDPSGGLDGAAGGSELAVGGTSGGLAASVSFAAKVAGATLGLTAAGVLVLRLGFVAVQGLAGAGAPAATSSSESDAAGANLGPELKARLAAEPTGPTEPVGPTEPTGPGAKVEGPASERGSNARVGSKLAQPSAPPASSLEAEAALIRAARESTAPRTVVELLERHAREFPTGMMSDEREALLVLAECELGQIEQAQARAQALARTRTNSPLLLRLRAGCPALDLPGSRARSGE